jgi:hypothetical protein
LTDPVSELNTGIEVAVVEGKLWQERADQLLEKLEQHVTDVITGEFRARSDSELRGEHGVAGFLGFWRIINTAADT